MVGPPKLLLVSTVCLLLALLTGRCEAAPRPHEVHIRHVRQGNFSDHGATIMQRDLTFLYQGRGAITSLVLLVTNYNETGQLFAAWGCVDLGNCLYTLPLAAFPISSGGSYGGWGYQAKKRFGLAKITVYSIVTVNDGTYQAPFPSPSHPAPLTPPPLPTTPPVSPSPSHSAVSALVSSTRNVVLKFSGGKFRVPSELRPMQFRPRRRRKGAVVCSLYDVVVEGDSCATLASFNNISLAALLAFNPRLNCSHLAVGFSACVGEETASAAPSLTCGLMYPPQQEDTCQSIMEDNLLTHTLFQRLNPGIVCNDFGGHQVCVQPLSTKAPNCPKIHPVSSGESCGIIQLTFRVERFIFQHNNPGVDCTRLNIGQKTCITPKYLLH